MIRFPLLAAALAFTGSNAPLAVTGDAVDRPARIVSANLCADQLLLAVADPAQIAALTRNARDPWMSAAAAQAKPFRMIRGTSEEILTLDPDLIVGAPEFRTTEWRSMARKDIAALDLPFANSLADIQTQLRAVAAATGHRARGDAIAAQMDKALVRLPRTGKGRIAAYYQRRGYLTGTGTLVDELMTRAGLANLATKLGKGALGRLTLEEMVAANPDILIVETDGPVVTDQGAEMLQHPALRHVPRVTLPQAWTVCGGPAYVQAARSLTAQLAAIPVN